MWGQAAKEKEVPEFQEHSALLALKPGKKTCLPCDLQCGREKPGRAALRRKQLTRSCTELLQAPSTSPCSQAPELAGAATRRLPLPEPAELEAAALTPSPTQKLAGATAPVQCAHPTCVRARPSISFRYHQVNRTHSSQRGFERMV